MEETKKEFEYVQLPAELFYTGPNIELAEICQLKDGQTPIINFPFKHKHSFMILLYLVSKVNKSQFGNVVKVKVTDIIEGAGLSAKSKNMHTAVLKSLQELNDFELISLYKHIPPRPEKQLKRKKPLNDQQLSGTDYLKKTAKRGDYIIEIHEDLIMNFYDERPKAYVNFPVEVLKNSDITSLSKSTYLYLLYHSQVTLITRSTFDKDKIKSQIKAISSQYLGDNLNLPKRTVQNQLTLLINAKLITRQIMTKKVDKQFTKVCKYLPHVFYTTSNGVVSVEDWE